MALDKHGELSAAVIAFYVPVALIALFLVLRYGFRRDAGWIFLFTFSIVRIVGGALRVAAEKTRPANINLYITAYIFEGIGLAPLLLATIGFLRFVGKGVFSDTPRATRAFRLLGLLAAAAVATSIVGGTDASSSDTNTQEHGVTLRRVAVILYVALYLLIVLAHLWAWTFFNKIQRNRRTLLIAVSCVLPFLAVRVLYSVLSAYSPNAFSKTASHSTNLSKFNSITGDWRIYLVMSLLMEYITVLIYIITGVLIPYSKDE